MKNDATRLLAPLPLLLLLSLGCVSWEDHQRCARACAEAPGGGRMVEYSHGVCECEYRMGRVGK